MTRKGGLSFMGFEVISGFWGLTGSRAQRLLIMANVVMLELKLRTPRREPFEEPSTGILAISS